MNRCGSNLDMGFSFLWSFGLGVGTRWSRFTHVNRMDLLSLLKNSRGQTLQQSDLTACLHVSPGPRGPRSACHLPARCGIQPDRIRITSFTYRLDSTESRWTRRPSCPHHAGGRCLSGCHKKIGGFSTDRVIIRDTVEYKLVVSFLLLLQNSVQVEQIKRQRMHNITRFVNICISDSVPMVTVTSFYTSPFVSSYLFSSEHFLSSQTNSKFLCQTCVCLEPRQHFKNIFNITIFFLFGTYV